MNSYLNVVQERKREALEKLVERCRGVERKEGRVAALKLYRTESGASLKAAMDALK